MITMRLTSSKFSSAVLAVGHGRKAAKMQASRNGSAGGTAGDGDASKENRLH